jgi:hypothetical protein
VLWFEYTGLCHYVYPGAMHSRFEHSLGAYHVAGQAVEILDRYQVSCMSVCCHCVQTGFTLCCCLLQAFRFSPIATGKKVGVNSSLVYLIYRFLNFFVSGSWTGNWSLWSENCQACRCEELLPCCLTW